MWPKAIIMQSSYCWCACQSPLQTLSSSVFLGLRKIQYPYATKGLGHWLHNYRLLFFGPKVQKPENLVLAPGFELAHFDFWQESFNLLCLSFIIYKMGITPPTTQDGYGCKWDHSLKLPCALGSTRSLWRDLIEFAISLPAPWYTIVIGS